MDEIWTATPGFDRTLEICLERIPFGEMSRVLDVPCGKGEALRRLAARWPIVGVGIDAVEPTIDAARRRTDEAGLADSLTFRPADATRLAFDDGEFDVCLSIGGPSCISPDVAKHAPPDAEQLAMTVAEQARVVRSGGYHVLSDMLYNPIDDHLRPKKGRLDAVEWHRLLRDAGLEVVYFEHYRVAIWDEYLEPRRERLRVARERAGDDHETLAQLDAAERGLEADQPPGLWGNYGIFVSVKVGR